MDSNAVETSLKKNGRYAPGAKGLLAPIEPWLKDPLISEILINKPCEIWFEKNGSFQAELIPHFNPEHLDRLFRLIANENGQSLSRKTPLLSGNLYDGSRVQLCLPPTAKYHTMSIRRKVVRDMDLQGYAQSGFFQHAEKAFFHAVETRLDPASENQKATEKPSEKELLQLYEKKEWDIFIQRAIQLKKNIVVSGGTSSGKTTFLNACLKAIPYTDRIIILEDTREIEIPHENQVQLLTSKGEQGEAKVTMQDLVQCCLRLRPDRIIMGEIRGAEILDFISACSTGHEGSLTSLHANNPQIAFQRMTQMYKLNNVPSMTDANILRELESVIDIMIQIEKTDGENAGKEKKRQVQSVYFKGAT